MAPKPYIPPKLPLKALDWGALVSSIARANRAVAHYDALLQGMPNPDLLITPLKREEAVLSSRIEGTRASVEDVLTHEAQPGPSAAQRAHTQNPEQAARYADIQEVRNYQRALDVAIELMKKRPLSLNLIRAVHQVLMDGVRGNWSSPGRFRTEQVWIGAAGDTLETATYVPPPPQELTALLHNWESYLHTQEQDTLTQAAIMHGQFELIHPFLDGNGRIGRILIPLFLYEKHILSRPTLYVSAYFERNRTAYYAHLNGLSAGEWEAWIAFFLEALERQATENAAHIQAVHTLYEEMKARAVKSTRSPYAVPILDYIFRQPIFSVPQVAQALEVDPKALGRVVKALAQAGLVEERQPKRGRQAAIYACEALLHIVRKEQRSAPDPPPEGDPQTGTLDATAPSV